VISFLQQEAIIQLLLEITICPNLALCVKAGFCQIQSHLLLATQLQEKWRCLQETGVRRTIP